MATRGRKPHKGNREPTLDRRPLIEESTVDFSLQQKCLDIFRDALQPSQDDAQAVQEVKGHLYDRNFSAAFGRDEYLRVYASRWSPSRALAYAEIFSHVTPNLSTRLSRSGEDGACSFNVVCIGGGAGGELVGLAGWFHAWLDQSVSAASHQHLHVRLIDVADWASITQILHNAITTPPKLSEYASQAKKEANVALLQSTSISTGFHRTDVLEPQTEALVDCLRSADLVTCMFTLNELYSASMPKTQQLLHTITDTVKSGAHFLVVDSPGSYSTVSVNGSEKKYPMQWLLDYTLRQPGQQKQDDKWQRLASEESRWFRHPLALQYPIDLENMRYQIHLYRRADTGG
ncbi:hypothetical protein BDY17DRAFT_114941 [Neohortaea acidophila]|uniref:Uncharacterized protein n=1 Tax=Neohortaea acidophila TaxID=245834 RepID=A0A6A6Q0F2_9PEZI|nr:uncharacterized protein BDY17DRAFT_114941 [Neohortaea acidophila]KAF2485890.1 hypothetical protein BDY17DRAFT_114941 [Neohortaea acidophila]